MKLGYKQTEVGVVPDEWDIQSLGFLCDVKDGTHESPRFFKDGVPFVTSKNIVNGRLDLENVSYVSKSDAAEFDKRSRVDRNDILLSMIGTIGSAALVDFEPSFCIKNVALLKPRGVTPSFLIQLICSPLFQQYLAANLDGGIQKFISLGTLRHLSIQVPAVDEQRAIAMALSDMDALLAGLDRLIAKKRDLKQAAMQQLLTGQTRLPGFQGEWESTTLEAATNCLDGLRVPLNEAERATMKGDIPYCGANGVLGFVDRYVIDDDIILMAEDGGYFDEYETRPIAYRMAGKCWVNNHAHILKARDGFDQGFIFYSLVHKNILPFLASGTRAKLNKSEMNKIAVSLPQDKLEQAAIATVLSDMDGELTALEARRDKTRALKQAMMQELLTGRTRLV